MNKKSIITMMLALVTMAGCVDKTSAEFEVFSGRFFQFKGLKLGFLAIFLYLCSRKLKCLYTKTKHILKV